MGDRFFARFVQRNISRRRWKEDREAAERVLRERADRYARDDGYKKRIIESVRRQREARGPSDRKRSFNRDKIVIINGVSVNLYSRGKTAHLVGVSPRTLESWEKKDLIPINKTKDRLGRSWYPAEFVMFLAELAVSRSKHKLSEWSSQVKDSWRSRQLSNHPIAVVGEHLEEADD